MKIDVIKFWDLIFRHRDIYTKEWWFMSKLFLLHDQNSYLIGAVILSVIVAVRLILEGN